MTHFYFADTETTDAGPTASVCEVGWIKTDENFSILESVESLIDPQQMISPSASGVHGLVNADVDHCPTLKEFFTEQDPSCHGELLKSPAVIIGHRISFDMRFLAPYFEQTPQELCTLRWVRKLYPEMPDHKLSTCAFALALPKPENAHRVLSDVMTAYYLCKHICERTGMTLEQLAQASLEPMPLTYYPFGKHKGTPFNEVPKSYLRWANENLTDIDADMKYTLRLHLK